MGLDRRLHPGGDGSDPSLLFGEVDSGFLHMELPRVSDADRVVEDAAVVGSDSIRFGRDYLRGREIEFTLGVADDPYLGALRKRDEFMHAWGAESVRNTPGAFSALEAPTGRMAFGRPRRVTPIEDVFLKVGGSRLLATFQTMTPYWYGEQRTFTAVHTGSISGGLTAPLTAPLTTVGEAVQRGTLNVTGDKPSSLRVVFTGPVTDPYVEVGEVRVRLKGSLAWDEIVEVDANPWSMSVLKQRGLVGGSVGPASGLLTADSTPMADLKLAPGEYDVFYGGRTLTSGAGATVFWRDAFAAY